MDATLAKELRLEDKVLEDKTPVQAQRLEDKTKNESSGGNSPIASTPKVISHEA